MEESQLPNIKQVIVMRRDLKMRRGKQIAQGVHASMAFLTFRQQSSKSMSLDEFSPNAQAWITGAFAEICVLCNSAFQSLSVTVFDVILCPSSFSGFF